MVNAQEQQQHENNKNKTKTYKGWLIRIQDKFYQIKEFLRKRLLGYCQLMYLHNGIKPLSGEGIIQGSVYL